jgi:hypothetical protein
MEMLPQGREVLAQLKQGASVQALEAAAEFARDSTPEPSSGALKTLQLQVRQLTTLLPSPAAMLPYVSSTLISSVLSSIRSRFVSEASV